MNTKTCIILSCLAAVSGCMNVQSRITLPDGTALRLPKDFRADVVNLTKHTNGTYSLFMTNVVSKMNPDVIDAKTRRDVELIKTGFEGGAKLIQSMPK